MSGGGSDAEIFRRGEKGSPRFPGSAGERGGGGGVLASIFLGRGGGGRQTLKFSGKGKEKLESPFISIATEEEGKERRDFLTLLFCHLWREEKKEKQF